MLKRVLLMTMALMSIGGLMRIVSSRQAGMEAEALHMQMMTTGSASSARKNG
jgi:hypothetical protein